jgi:hypothetical protein
MQKFKSNGVIKVVKVNENPYNLFGQSLAWSKDEVMEIGGPTFI